MFILSNHNLLFNYTTGAYTDLKITRLQQSTEYSCGVPDTNIARSFDVTIAGRLSTC